MLPTRDGMGADMESEWTIDDELQAVRSIAAALAQSGAKTRIRLLISDDLDVHQDEVLVQRVDRDRRTITVEPVAVRDLRVKDVLFDTSVVDPTDVAYTEHAELMQAGKCLYRYPDGKNHQGIYE